MKLMIDMLIDIYTDVFPFDGDYEDDAIKTLYESLDMIINSYRKRLCKDKYVPYFNTKDYYSVHYIRSSYYEFANSYLKSITNKYIENPSDPDRFVRNIEKIMAKLITENIEPDSESSD